MPIGQWSNVLFSNETRLSLIGPDSPNERFSPCTVVKTVGFQGGSIMLWGGIPYEAHMDLVILESAINALK